MKNLRNSISIFLFIALFFSLSAGFADARPPKPTPTPLVHADLEGPVCNEQLADMLNGIDKAGRSGRTSKVATYVKLLADGQRTTYNTLYKTIPVVGNNTQNIEILCAEFEAHKLATADQFKTVGERLDKNDCRVEKIELGLTTLQKEVKALNGKLTTKERQLANAISQTIAQSGTGLLGIQALQEKVHTGQRIFYVGFPAKQTEITGLVKTKMLATVKAIQDAGLLIYKIEGTSDGVKDTDAKYANDRGQNLFAFAEDNVPSNMKADVEITSVTGSTKGHGCHGVIHCKGDPSVVNTVKTQTAVDARMAKATVKAASLTLATVNADLAVAEIKLVSAVLDCNTAKTDAETAKEAFNSVASVPSSATDLATAQTKMLDADTEYKNSETSLVGVQSDARECEDDVTAAEEALEEAEKALQRAETKKKRITRP